MENKKIKMMILGCCGGREAKIRQPHDASEVNEWQELEFLTVWYGKRQGTYDKVGGWRCLL